MPLRRADRRLPPEADWRLRRLAAAWNESPEYPRRDGPAGRALAYALYALMTRGYIYERQGEVIGWSKEETGDSRAATRRTSAASNR